MPVRVVIASFTGEYRFLSNFHPCPIELDGEVYGSVEHAYQAAKTSIPAERARIRLAPTAAIAKKLGRWVTMEEGWEASKVAVMRELVRQKFENPILRKALLRTGGAELVEGNWWGDTFWGVHRGSGENWLGRILMEVREELQKEARNG